MRRYIPEWAKLVPAEAKQVFAGEIYQVYQWPQTLFDGSTAAFEMLRRPDTVKIVAVKDGKIVITKQTQPREGWFYDLPGGRVDEEDVDELTAAKRELLEETGLKFRSWKLIGVHQPFNKIDWLVYTFLATDFEGQVAQQLDAGEKIEVVEVTWPELEQHVQSKMARFLRFDGMEAAGSVDGLLELPELYRY